MGGPQTLGHKRPDKQTYTAEMSSVAGILAFNQKQAEKVRGVKGNQGNSY